MSYFSILSLIFLAMTEQDSELARYLTCGISLKDITKEIKPSDILLTTDLSP